MTKSFGVSEARQRLPELIDRALAGEDVVISRHGVPVARIQRLGPSKSRVRYGLANGKLKVPADFDRPLPDAVQSSFEGS